MRDMENQSAGGLNGRRLIVVRDDDQSRNVGTREKL